METWKKIEGFENYMVSDKGNVLSLKYNKSNSQKFLSKFEMPNGYHRVELRNGDGKRHPFLVHRLVAMVFIPNPKSKSEVNHKNGIKSDDSLENLEWVTPKENQRHSCKIGIHKHRFSKFQVQRMRLLKEVQPEISYAKLGRLFNAHRAVIRNIILRKSWQHI